MIFTIEKYVTASQLVQVNLASGKWTELFSVAKAEVIRSGQHKGKLLVGRSEVRNLGRQVYYSVCSQRGETLLELPTFDEYMIYRSQAMVKGVTGRVASISEIAITSFY